MIYEIANIEIQNGLEAAFEQGVAAAELFRRAGGCHGLGLQR